MRLRTVIFGVYVATSAVGFVVLLGLLLWEVRPRYADSIRRALQDTAGLVAGLLEARLAAAPEEPGVRELPLLWEGSFAELQGAMGGLRLTVLSRDGTVLWGPAGAAEQATERRGVLADSYERWEAEDTRRDLRASHPVRWHGRDVAFVQVERPLGTVQQWIASARWRIVALALAIAAAMVAVGWWVAQRVARSIERLTQYVEVLRRRGTARPPESRALEISQLAQAFEELREALEGKAYVERYTQNLAHELKAPLTALRGAAELLSENPPAEVRDRFLANLRAEVERIRQVVDRLLELAAVENRREAAATEPADLRALAAEVTAEARSGRREGEWCIELATDVAPVVARVERWLVRQALANLVANALDFTPPGGAIRIAVECRPTPGPCAAEPAGIAAPPADASPDAAWVHFSVEDSGPGVPDYALPRVFERFYSLPRPATGRKSSGLGLSLVREVARLHGGEAWLENRPVGGVCASFSLRLHR